MKGIQGRLGRGRFGAAVFVLAFLVLVLAITSGVARGAGAAQPGAPLAGESLHPSYRLSASYPTCRLNLTGSIDCWTDDNDGKATTQIGPYVQVGSGGGHSCGLRPDGSVDCWGINNYGQAEDQTGPFVQIALGSEYHTCALRANGSVDCWGNNSYGQAEDQEGPFVQITAGPYHTCGLKSDGSALCWGTESWGVNQGHPGPFTQISAGYDYNCGLKADGHAVCWGDGTPADPAEGPFVQLATGASHVCGLLADGRVDCWGSTYMFNMAVDQAGPYIQISAAWWHTCAMSADGSVDCWGQMGFDQPAPLSLPGEAVGAGDGHSCALRPNGRIDCWGNNQFGQAADRIGPFVQVSVGWYHTCGLKPDGAVDCWGKNAAGQAADPAGLFQYVDAGAFHTCGLRPNGRVDCWGRNGQGEAEGRDGPFVQIAVDNSHTCGLRPNGSVDCWGYDEYGETADQTGPFTQITTGLNHTCGLKLDGKIDCWGNDDVGQAQDQAGSFSRVTAGAGHTCAIDRTDGHALCWGLNGSGQAADPAGPFMQISAGGHHTCALKTNSEAVCWGANDSGESTARPGSFGVYVVPESPYVSAGITHTCGLRPDGRIDCWGDNQYGKATDQVGPYTMVSAGGDHTCGLRVDGSVDCWGDNESGQAEDQAGPFVWVSAGGANSCALKSDGSAHCWGFDYSDGATDQVGPFTALSAGLDLFIWGGFEYHHNCGLRPNGSVDCWGGQMYVDAVGHDGPFRQMEAGWLHACGLAYDGGAICWEAEDDLAQGEEVDQAGPFIQISTRLGHSCGLKPGGGLDCWGDNEWGQAISQAGYFRRIYTGGRHTCGLKFDGSVDCWGNNEFGQAEDQTGPFGPYVPPDYVPPVAVNDAYTVDQRQTLTVSAPGVMGNDTHYEDYPITAWRVTTAAHGSVTLNDTGAFTYVPTATFSGTDTFTYKVNDGQADSNVATVTITVRPVYDPPVTIGEMSYYLPRPEDDVYVLDSAPTLDEYRYNTDGPIQFALDVTRVVGRTDANGYLKDVDWLIAAGIVPPKVTLVIRAYDVDTTYSGTDVRPERNKVYVNGQYVGDLTGRNDDWKQTFIQVDVRKIRFAVPQCNEGGREQKPVNISECATAPIPGHNEIRVDVDVDNSQKVWGIGVESVALMFEAARPILLVHGRGGSKAGDDPCSVPNVGVGCEYWDKDDGEYYFGFRGRLNSAGFLTLHMENFMGQGAPVDHAKIIKRVVGQMRTRYGVDRINIVAHSKGGLDSRAYISDFSLNPDNDVETLITLATPQFGSFMAAVSWGVSWMGIDDYEYTDAMESLRELKAYQFSMDHPARGGVRYHAVYAESGRWCFRVKWIWFVGPVPVAVRCAEFEQAFALPERKQQATAALVYDILLKNGLYAGGNDFMVTERSANLFNVPGHNSSNTTLNGPRDLNHHSIAAALRRYNDSDMSIVNYIANKLRVNAPSSPAGPAFMPQATPAALEAGASSLGMFSGVIAEGQTRTQTVGIDAVTSASIVLSWGAGDLYLSLVDPTGRVITSTTADPKITYGEVRTDEQTYTEFLPGKSAVFTMIEPPYGEWQAKITAAGQLPSDQADWVVTVVQDSDITLSLTPDATWRPLNGTVKLTSKVMIKDAPLAGATVTCTVVRPDGTTQTVALLDDGAHNDGAARDGVYGNSFVGSQYGDYSLSAMATGTAHEIPFLRTSFSEVQFGSGTARVSGAFSDRGVDTDGDGLYNTLQVDVPVQVTTAGEYAAFAELRSASGGVLAYANATAELVPGQRKLTLNFSGEEIWANGGNGRFTLADLRLNDMGADAAPLRIDFKPAPYTTASYLRDQFQHAPAGLTGVTHDYGVDSNGNGKYDELVVEVEVYLEAGGAYTWSGKLVDGAGYELGGDGGELTLEAGLRTITFHFNGNTIGASRHHGPYFLVDLYLWGDGGFVSMPSAATTAFYNYRQFEGAPATVELFLPAISR